MSPTIDQQTARLVRSVHDNMKTRGTGMVTLESLAQEMFNVHGLNLSTDEISDCLNMTRADPDRGGPGRSAAYFSRHAQGQSGTSAKAHDASLHAAEMSQQAREAGDSISHGTAASLHADAAAAHRRCAAYHDKASAWHDGKVRGDEQGPEPEDDGGVE